MTSHTLVRTRSAILLCAAQAFLVAQGLPAADEQANPPVVLHAGTIVTHDVRYAATDDPHQSLDIYSPAEASAAPVWVFIHGGGWSRRDKDEVGAQPRLFNAAGAVVVSVNYRLAPAVRHPDNVRDVAAAIAWIHGHIAEHGGDPEKIVLMGHSAGSHLAALVATDDRYLAAHGLHRDQLAGVVTLDGSAFDIPDRVQHGSATIADNCRRAFGDDAAVQADGSPINHVGGDRRLPPFLLVYLTEESLNHAQSQRFAERVREAGGAATLRQATDRKTHQALCDDLGTETDHTGPALVDFLRAVTQDR